VTKRIDRLHPTLRALQLENAKRDADRITNAKPRKKADPTLYAERLGRKNRNNGDPVTANPYDKPDPCHEAWWRGWVKRNAELPNE
jgi:hypothetical protein